MGSNGFKDKMPAFLHGLLGQDANPQPGDAPSPSRKLTETPGARDGIRRPSCSRFASPMASAPDACRWKTRKASWDPHGAAKPGWIDPEAGLRLEEDEETASVSVPAEGADSGSPERKFKPSQLGSAYAGGGEPRKTASESSGTEEQVSQDSKEGGDGWHSSSAFARGLSHERRGEPCQDRAAVFHDNGTHAICLADGAGSYPSSQLGAEVIVRDMGRLLVQYFDRVLALSETDKPCFFEDVMKRTLSNTARRLGCRIRDLSSTFLAVAVKGDRYMTIHIGDGVIGAVESDVLKVISMPWNGEYDNITVFTTYPRLRDHIRVSMGDASDIAGFILMSDGAGDTLHVHGTEELAPAAVKLMLYCAEHPEEVDEALQETLDELLVKKTADDCSVALLARRPEQLQRCLDKVSENWDSGAGDEDEPVDDAAPETVEVEEGPELEKSSKWEGVLPTEPAEIALPDFEARSYGMKG